MGAVWIDDAIRLAVIRRYQAEEISILNLSREHGVSRQTVFRWLRDAGVKRRRQGLKIGCLPRPESIHVMPIIPRRAFEGKDV